MRHCLAKVGGKVSEDSKECLAKGVEPNPSFVPVDHRFVEVLHADERIFPRANVGESGSTHSVHRLAQGRNPAGPQLIELCHGETLLFGEWILATKDLLDIDSAARPEDSGRLPVQGTPVGGITGDFEVEGHIE